MVKNNFSVFFSPPQEHTSPTTLMDARQWPLTGLLFLLFGPCAFKRSYQAYHAIFLFVVVSQANRGHIRVTMVFSAPPRYTSPASLNHQRHAPMTMGISQPLFTHYSELKITGDMLHHAWVFLNCFFIHPKGPNVMRDVLQGN